NVGPQVQIWHHLDNMNKMNGICPVFNTGTFDPVKGSYIVFPQLRVVMEFLPGTLVLISSVTLVHGNTSIQEDEEQKSITFYTASELFRWAKYGFQTEEDFQQSNPDRWATELEKCKTR
ncbi:hypothetical protein BDY19DRAFT_892703, partial [Irpex rosettiformis]